MVARFLRRLEAQRVASQEERAREIARERAQSLADAWRIRTLEQSRQRRIRGVYSLASEPRPVRRPDERRWYYEQRLRDWETAVRRRRRLIRSYARIGMRRAMRDRGVYEDAIARRVRDFL